MSSSRRALAAVAAVAATLTGCGAATPRVETGVTAVAAFYPLEFVTEAVGGERVAVTNLTKPGAEPHDLELAPRDVAAVSDADLVVYLSGFQPAVDDAVQARAGGVLDAAGVADLSPVAGEPAPDPHFWLDPMRLADVGEAVADRLGEADPDGASTYADNAASLREDLAALDEELATGLASCEVRHLVTGHTAFGYLAHRYGFTQVPISGLSPDDEPNPRALVEVAEHVRRHGVRTVYSEVLADPAVADTVAAEAGAGTAVLDPVEGITEDSAGDDYLSVMRANLQTLREGQGCS